MIILKDREGQINGTLDGIATVSGNCIYAVVLYKDGTSDDVGSVWLPRQNSDYSVIYFPEEGDKGTIQFTNADTIDAILVCGPGRTAGVDEWLDMDMGGVEIATAGSNVLLVEFGDENTYVVTARKDETDLEMPKLKRMVPTLWGRDQPGRLAVEFSGS